MYFLTHSPSYSSATLNRDVAVTLDDARAAALGARAVATEGRRLVDLDRRDLQFVDVRTVVVLGVGNRRLEHLLDDARALSSA